MISSVPSIIIFTEMAERMSIIIFDRAVSPPLPKNFTKFSENKSITAVINTFRLKLKIVMGYLYPRAQGGKGIPRGTTPKPPIFPLSSLVGEQPFPQEYKKHRNKKA